MSARAISSWMKEAGMVMREAGSSNHTQGARASGRVTYWPAGGSSRMNRRQPFFVAIRHPLRFAWEAAKAFRANQGLLLAGAVAYYALLSIVPLLILSVMALSRFIEQDELLATIARYLEWVLPGQS